MDADELQKRLDDLADLKVRGIITEVERQMQRTALITAYTTGQDAPATAPTPTNPPAMSAPPVAPTKADGSGAGILKWGLGGCVAILAAIGLLVVLAWVVIIAAFSSATTTSDGVVLDTGKILGDVADMTVVVDGDAGLPFSGALGTGANQKSVEGVIPQTFTIAGKDSGGIFVAVLQKQQQGGRMTVTLACPGGDKTGETTAAYGLVTVSC